MCSSTATVSSHCLLLFPYGLELIPNGFLSGHNPVPDDRHRLPHGHLPKDRGRSDRSRPGASVLHVGQARESLVNLRHSGV